MGNGKIARHVRRAMLGTAVLGMAGIGMTLLGSGAPEPSLARPFFDEDAFSANSTPEVTVDFSDAKTIPAAPGGAGALYARDEIAATPPRRSLQVFCSPSAHRLIGAPLERAFESTQPGIDLVLLVDTDRNCVGHLIMGSADLAMIAVELSNGEKERKLDQQVIGHLLMVPVVHPSNKLDTVNLDVLRGMLDGRFTSWIHAGGDRLEMQAVCRPPGPRLDAPDQLLRFSELAANRCVYLNSPQEIIAYVANNVSALGLVSLAEVRGERRIKALQVDAVGARLDHYRRGTWRLGCTFRAVTHPAPTSQDAKAWLAYLQGPTARGLLRRYMTLE